MPWSCSNSAVNFFISRVVGRGEGELLSPKVVENVKQHRNAKDGAAHGARRGGGLNGRVDGGDAAGLHDGLAGVHVVDKGRAHDVAFGGDGRGTNVAAGDFVAEGDCGLEAGAVRLRDDVLVVADGIDGVGGKLSC